jgi:Zinc carboxypeptidase
MKAKLFIVILVTVCLLPQGLVFGADKKSKPIRPQHNTALEFINTSFENASKVDWEIDAEGNVVISLIYDHERSSPNRANGHWHFQLQAKPGSDFTLILKNFVNVYNGRYASTLDKRKTMATCYVSHDGVKWVSVPTERLSDNLLKVPVHMENDTLYVAGVEPYRLSDLEKLIAEIQSHALVDITTIGKTVHGRQLEIIRVGRPDAPYRILIRARAHPWESGGNWVVQGLIRSLLRDNDESARYLKKYCLYIMPMANKDGVVRGFTRFNQLGVDLNRKWGHPADPRYAPENHALETWLKGMIANGKKFHLAIDFHNDNGGHVIVCKPGKNVQSYHAVMKHFEQLLYKHSWFREGFVGWNRLTQNRVSFEGGMVERFGIPACVFELNANWIKGLNKVPFGKDWELLGEQLAVVFDKYFQ